MKADKTKITFKVNGETFGNFKLREGDRRMKLYIKLNKEETANKYGKEQVRRWRRSYNVSPPGGESLENVVTRVKPYFINFIEPKISEGQNVLIVAHGNSLRATMIQVGLYKAEEISKIEIPTGRPFVITYETGKVVNSKYLS